jgi:outer membrane murein-binding lipoprotein Lpp
MSVKKQLIESFKNLLGLYFEKVFTYDQIKISDKAVGGKVEMIQADGSLGPVEDGDYVMDDGFSFTIKDGQIASIVGEDAPEVVDVVEEVEAGEEKKEDEEEKMEEPVVEEPVQSEEDNKVAELEAKVAELESKIDSILNSMEMMKSEKDEAKEAIQEFNKQVAQLNDNIKTLAKVPVEFSKTNKTPLAEESKMEKINDLATIFANIKN